jgi:serine beta-lactamase-like protein LACTB, mitochondrial
MRKFILAGMAIGLSLIAYALFRPLIVWPFGWQTFPDVQPATATPHTASEPASILDRHYRTGNYPSLSAAISIDGKVVWTSVRGYSDLNARISATSDSQYRIGSSSKAVNATVAALLVAQGRLDLDAPITRYIDYYPDKGHTITTRQLLSHTAGIRHYGICFCAPIWDYENTRHFDSVQQAVGTFSRSPLVFEPGTGFAYSSYGTVLSSGVMEVAGGSSYLTLVNQLVTRPLRLKGLSPDDRTIPNDHRARFYEVGDGTYRDALPTDDSIKWAGGGFVATPTDMVQLGSAWLREDFLPADVRTDFWTPQRLKDGSINTQNYALGWRVGEITHNGKPIRVIHHNGTAKGSSSSFMLFPDYDMAVSVMTNRGTQGGDPFPGFAQELGLAMLKADAGD